MPNGHRMDLAELANVTAEESKKQTAKNGFAVDADKDKNDVNSLAKRTARLETLAGLR